MAWPEAIVQSENYTLVGLLFYAAIIFVITLISYMHISQKISVLNQIPGPKTSPVIGNALDLMTPPTELFKVLTSGYCIFPCGLTRLWIAHLPYCLLYSANAVEKILSSPKYIDKSVDYEALQPWLGTGLLTATGAKWRQRRKMLTPTFHFKILEDFIDVFNQQSSKFVSNLKVKADGTPFNIFQYITLCTLDIILETAMGRRINAQDNESSDYVQAVKRIGTIIVQRTNRPWLEPDILFKLFGYAKEHDDCLKILHGLAYDTIRERRKEYQLLKTKNEQQEKEDEAIGKSKRLAFLDLLLEYSETTGSLTDEDIREEVDTFMFEGHDTIAAALNWCIYLIGSYPDVQDKLFEELDAIYGDSDRPATSADLREMKYLECCIKEALRLFPSVPFIGRTIKEDITIDGFKIPNGTNILIINYSLHRDPKHFPEPEEYKPERFFPENSAKRHPYAYVPFSAGPRNCIGQKFAMMEEKTVLSSFFRKYRVESMEKREDLKLIGDLVLRPEGGTSVKLFPRK